MLRSRSHRLPKPKGEPRRGWLARCTLVGTLLFLEIICFEKTYSVAADNYKPIHYKQYILIQLNDISEAYCLVELYSKENSKWDPKARNGSHIGIPQGRSKYLATVNGVKQIDWGIKYINNRYGSMCKALQHFKIKGWH
jgi:hypothetical protein